MQTLDRTASTDAIAEQAAKSRSGSVRGGRISPIVLEALACGVETTVLAGLGIGLASIYAAPAGIDPDLTASASVAVAAIATCLFQLLHLDTVPAMQRLGRHLPRVLAGWSVAISPLVVTSLLVPGLRPATGWLAAWSVAGLIALVATRITLAVVASHWSRQGRLTRRAVIYGSGTACQDLLKALAADADSDIRVCGIYDDRGVNRGAASAGYPNHGSLDNLIGFARSSQIDLVLLALPISAETRLMQLLTRLWVLPADIRLAASASRLRLAPRAYSNVGAVELIALADKPISDLGAIAKATFDRVIGLFALIALTPVMLATAIAIKLDSKGPVLFRQKRYGFNNELIEVFKFRSMHTDVADQSASKLVTRNDPRVTRVGRFIRKSSLDELPQLFNVLIGNLSLVGPRPHAVSAKAGGKLYNDAFDGYFARHKVKPGITGWAQINGWRGETDTEDKLRHRVEHDLYYIENWSVLFDAWILLRTPASLVKTRNAY